MPNMKQIIWQQFQCTELKLGIEQKEDKKTNKGQQRTALVFNFNTS